MTCRAPPGERVVVSPVLGDPLWKEIARLIEGAGPRVVASLYGYTGDEAFILVLYIENGRVVAACYDSGREVTRGDEAARRAASILAGEASGLLEVVRPEKWEPPRGERLSRSVSLEELASRSQRGAPPAGGRPGERLLEGLDGISVGVLLSEVILHSRLIASARSYEEALRRARQESRRDRSGLYRVAVFLEDGGIYNIFVRDGRIRRVIYLAPSGIEGRVLGRDENIREILSRARVRGASVYRVECPECEKAILTG